jgi:hypothetical protein
MPFYPVKQRLVRDAKLALPIFCRKYLLIVRLTLAALFVMAIPWHNLRSPGAWIVGVSVTLIPAALGIAVGTTIFTALRYVVPKGVTRIVSAAVSFVVSIFAGAFIVSPVVMLVMHMCGEHLPERAIYFVVACCAQLAGVIGCVFGAGPGLPSHNPILVDSGEES